MHARVRTPSLPVRERERKRERKIEREKNRERRERCKIWLFLFLKGMTGALAPFSYLVTIIFNKCIGRGLRCWSEIPCRLPTIIEIKANSHQDFVASMNSNFFQGQTDRGLFYGSYHTGETQLSKQEDDRQ